ncbi:2-C-methyl-D-erythritol 4-phosphate cytidylyltransferase [Candidatus Schneideria nysicola]|uniref:2-C-methyl-D-erythritol 4-phosphate cytidylyltransferase n=1 Tax=Candidatus Schneideria nysicola TaxID=1081631 RepID=UPI001CAA5CE1|nr:2-C-methyl-D-erythritol 4-phosphate cytidylyltransferase [Candidatus Schneideria nysicola]UAJ65847.1 2-C-methyl-D-erythritol 4-phosphate cytidylyltransferase [Candidatus Schneideria nysicola]
MYQSYPKIIAILPAAGRGHRMQSSIPKQYLTIGNKTILEHAIFPLLSHKLFCQIVVVLNITDKWFYKLPIAMHSKVSTVVIGGYSRSISVMAALSNIKNKTTNWILTHDAVRPCLKYYDLCRLMKITKYSKVGGILATRIHDTVKRASLREKNISYTIKRDRLWRALTPQLFNFDLLKYCLGKALREGATITDEASAMEYCGYQPLLIPCSNSNIKVTYKEDLELATFYLSKISNEKR